jgi:pimeloyl-ACP methyl ester carboxylesterase
MESIVRLSPLEGNWYLLESTATLEVDRADPGGGPSDGSKLSPPTMDGQIAEFAKRVVSDGQEPAHIVFFVHGYNNDESAVLKRIADAQRVTKKAPLDDKRTFYVGYRWPSETMLRHVGSALTGCFPLLWLVAIVGLLCLPAGWLAREFSHRHLGMCLIVLGWGLFTLVLGSVFLHVSKYYRDSYRASNYGVLDLVEFVRRLDNALKAAMDAKGVKARVALSFVGHSMGGFVVTNTVRVLTDVFHPQSIQPEAVASTRVAAAESAALLPSSLDGLAGRELTVSPALDPDLGHALTLLRMVLVSPDIPALALVTGRANFLGPSIRRCAEAYLVSNGGDVVLSMISTTANYFTFPASRARNAARLGNVQVISRVPGVYAFQGDLQRSLRIGKVTLRDLQTACDGPGLGDAESVSRRFTFIDCTGFRTAKGARISNSDGSKPIGLGRRLWGLFQYLFLHKDCHSGYFDHDETLRIIFGSAAVGLPALKLSEQQDVKDRGLRICLRASKPEP